MPRRQISRWALPQVVDPETRKCASILVPDDREHIAAFKGALLDLARAYSWENDEDHTAIDVAKVWEDAMDTLTLDAECSVADPQFEARHDEVSCDSKGTTSLFSLNAGVSADFIPRVYFFACKRNPGAGQDFARTGLHFQDAFDHTTIVGGRIVDLKCVVSDPDATIADWEVFWDDCLSVTHHETIPGISMRLHDIDCKRFCILKDIAWSGVCVVKGPGVCAEI